MQVTGVNFYKATELPEFKIDNVDQRVTTDVEQFCEQGCEMFCDVFKPSAFQLHIAYEPPAPPPVLILHRKWLALELLLPACLRSLLAARPL